MHFVFPVISYYNLEEIDALHFIVTMYSKLDRLVGFVEAYKKSFLSRVSRSNRKKMIDFILSTNITNKILTVNPTS